jgi:hypothetical protein
MDNLETLTTLGTQDTVICSFYLFLVRSVVLIILSIFGAVRGAHHFSSLCFVLCIVCRRPVSCVPNVVS